MLDVIGYGATGSLLNGLNHQVTNDWANPVIGKSVAGSLIGSIAETQEVLDFCAAKNIVPEIQLLDIKDINDAFSTVAKGDVRFRHVAMPPRSARDHFGRTARPGGRAPWRCRS